MLETYEDPDDHWLIINSDSYVSVTLETRWYSKAGFDPQQSYKTHILHPFDIRAIHLPYITDIQWETSRNGSCLVTHAGTSDKTRFVHILEICRKYKIKIHKCDRYAR